MYTNLQKKNRLRVFPLLILFPVLESQKSEMFISKILNNSSGAVRGNIKYSAVRKTHLLVLYEAIKSV